MRIACWIPKTTNTHSEYVTLTAFHGYCGYANVPRCYVMRIVAQHSFYICLSGKVIARLQSRAVPSHPYKLQ